MFNKNKQKELNKIVANDFRRLNQVLNSHGINLAPFLAEQNLELNKIVNLQLPLQASQFHHVVKQVLKSCDIPGLGLKTGRLLELTDYGILGYALLSSKNLRKATEIGSKYRIMTSELIDLSLHIQGNSAISRFKEARPLHWGQPYMIEESLSITWKLIKSLLQLSNNIKPIKIRLAFSKPSYSQLFDDMFQCPVIYEANANEIYFPVSWIDRPIPTADETAAKVCSQQCDLISAQMLNQGSVVDQVRRILMASPMQSRFHINGMADKLNLSPRTFRQRLYDAGTSYKEVINEVRMQMAIEYLQTTQFSVQEVAYLLGYDYSPNFFRAFKKSVGITPSEYRHKIEQEYAERSA
ncbi:hypothetical protein A9Q81_10635 [Gammaproteobacteria bacterium 42_54_T18]|nr:hypothetical protein A9Q81_10635 [Gammaproteobacteria bacterium 42_54_T18]